MRGKRWWAVVVVGTAVGHCAVQAAEAQPRGDAASIEEAKRLDDEVQALCEAGKYDAAIPLAERSLTMMESAWGPDHPHVATSLNNLAEIYRAKGEYDRAEALHQRALTIRENTLAPGHPDIASSLDNLAVVYEEKGDYD